MNIEQILSEIMKLDKKKQLDVFKRLKKKLQSINDRAGRKDELVQLSDLNGLGTEVWGEEDIDSYIENERAWD